MGVRVETGAFGPREARFCCRNGRQKTHVAPKGSQCEHLETAEARSKYHQMYVFDHGPDYLSARAMAARKSRAVWYLS